MDEQYTAIRIGQRYWSEHQEQYTFQKINAKGQVVIGDGLRKMQEKMGNQETNS